MLEKILEGPLDCKEIHTKGSVTLLLQLRRKAHVHATTGDED